MNITPFETAIKNYLDKLAADDPFFMEKLENPKKSIAECCKYIIAEVQKARNGQQCVAVSDEEVYGLAVHYYDEKDVIVEETPIPAKVVPVEDVKVAAPKPKRQPKQAPQPEPEVVEEVVEEVEAEVVEETEDITIAPLQFNIF